MPSLAPELSERGGARRVLEEPRPVETRGRRRVQENHRKGDGVIKTDKKGREVRVRFQKSMWRSQVERSHRIMTVEARSRQPRQPRHNTPDHDSPASRLRPQRKVNPNDTTGFGIHSQIGPPTGA